MSVVHCKKSKFDVYIGREMPEFPNGSIWANPFKIGIDGTRDDVLQLYETHIRNDQYLMSRILELDGKVLGCWCYPKRCHGDVIISIINEIKLFSLFDWE